MPQFRSLPSFHHDDADVIEEPLIQAVPVSQPLTLKAFATVSSSPMTRELSAGRENEPITGPMTGPTTGPMLDQLSPQTQPIARNAPFLSLVPMQSVQPQTPHTFAPVATSSLITALQSTIAGQKKTEQMVVIPATMKRTQVLPETIEQPRRMRRRFRHAIALGITLAVLLLTLLSLAPLDDGQSTYHIFASTVQWGSMQQQNWNISAHTIAQLPGNGGGMTSGDTAANSTNLPNLNLPTSQYVAIAQQDAIEAGISPDYFVRQIYAESSFNPNAYSPAGAVGIAQFEPSTAYSLGVNPYDPISALHGAAKLMASYNAQYGGDYAKALAAYNAGGGNVQIAVQNCGANWLSCMPAETQNYVYKIMGI